MRKVNVVFLGECIIIVALLLLIGNLLRTEENYVWGKEAAEAESLTEEEPPKGEESGIIQYARDLLGEEQNQTVSGNYQASISGNRTSENTVSGNQTEEMTAQENEQPSYWIQFLKEWDFRANPSSPWSLEQDVQSPESCPAVPFATKGNAELLQC